MRGVKCLNLSCKPVGHIPQLGNQAGFCGGIYAGSKQLCIQSNDILRIRVTDALLDKIKTKKGLAKKPEFCNEEFTPIYNDGEVAFGILRGTKVINGRYENYVLCTRYGTAYLNDADLEAILKVFSDKKPKRAVPVTSDLGTAMKLATRTEVVLTTCSESKWFNIICLKADREDQVYSAVLTMLDAVPIIVSGKSAKIAELESPSQSHVV